MLDSLKNRNYMMQHHRAQGLWLASLVDVMSVGGAESEAGDPNVESHRRTPTGYVGFVFIL